MMVVWEVEPELVFQAEVAGGGGCIIITGFERGN